MSSSGAAGEDARKAQRFKRRVQAVDSVLANVGFGRPAALVTGFWRSGTTWVLECLAQGLHAKSVFEPFSPHNPVYQHLIEDLPLTSFAERHAFLPDIPPQKAAAFWAYLDKAFRGYCPGETTIICRKSLAESFRPRTVVKCVRMQLSVGAIHARYGVPVIHVRRHPCAVAASLLGTRWNWSFSDLRLADFLDRDLLPEPEAALLAERLHVYDADALSRMAAYWAVTELAVERQLAAAEGSRIVSYEALTADPEQGFNDLCRALGRTEARPIEWTADSPVTSAASRSMGVQQRAEAWKSRLTAEQIDRIAEIVGELMGDQLPGIDDLGAVRPVASAAA
jgi:hypothetical protein